MKFLAALSLFMGFAWAARADTILLKNGDHLTGTIEHSDGKQLTLKTDYAGEINLQLSAVKQVVSDTPVYVITTDKKTVNGKLNIEGTDVYIAPAAGPAVQVPLAHVTLLRSQSEQAAYEHSLHPGFTEDWTISTTVGFSLARGNSDTTNISTGFSGVRATLNDKLTTYANTIYASSNTPGTSGVTANDVRGGARYDHDFQARLFGFGSADYEYNQLQDLNLRQIYSGGLGVHVIKQTATTFDVLLGANYTRESYSASTIALAQQRNVAGVTLGEDFMHKFWKTNTFTEQFNFYPDLSNTGQYRFTLDTTLANKLYKWLSWQTTGSDVFVSDPIPGVKKNDLILTTGLNIAFKD
jgi:putative salt-induced outer membrane protein